MYFESIFSDTTPGNRAIYWLTVNGPNGKTVDSSSLEIDKTHNRYFSEVIRKGSRQVMKTEIYHMPVRLKNYINTAGTQLYINP